LLETKMEIPKLSPLKQIRIFCLYCMNEHRKDVLFCRDTNCPFWFLRLGMNPKRAINQNGKRYEEVFKPENFEKGAKFSPDKETSSLKV